MKLILGAFGAILGAVVGTYVGALGDDIAVEQFALFGAVIGAVFGTLIFLSIGRATHLIR